MITKITPTATMMPTSDQRYDQGPAWIDLTMIQPRNPAAAQVRFTPRRDFLAGTFQAVNGIIVFSVRQRVINPGDIRNAGPKAKLIQQRHRAGYLAQQLVRISARRWNGFAAGGSEARCRAGGQWLEAGAGACGHGDISVLPDLGTRCLLVRL